jgi:pimeloyl-ACP methyl ester carboxylesterase
VAGRAIVVALAAALGLGVFADASAVAGLDDVYARDESWLCRPGRQDACAVNEDATIIAPDGKLTLEPFHPDPDAPIDCFYVYPTVSDEPTGNSDLAVGAGERRAAQQQLARFASKCRLYAPLYRQITLTALRAAKRPRPIPFDAALPYRDIAAAFRDYLARDNRGRGFVVIGHSQGSTVLAQLIRDEIDGKPIQGQLVSAILMGVGLPAPTGDQGAPFKHIPMCHSNQATGCVIAFASFRANLPPPAGSLFVAAGPGKQAACANPAALPGGAGMLDSYLSTNAVSLLDDTTSRRAWTNPPQTIATPFVKLPGLLSAQCVAKPEGAHLEVRVHPTPGARANDITGDVIVAGKPRPEWGLHLIDANLVMGNLIAIVGEEAEAYLAEQR